MNTGPTLVPVVAPSGNTPVELPRLNSTRTQVGFKGAVTGTVTITVRPLGTDRFMPVTDGVVDLAVKNYAYIPDIAIEAINFNYSGAGALSATIYSFSN